MYYPNIDKKWSSIMIAAKIDKKYSTTLADYAGYSELVTELRSGQVGEKTTYAMNQCAGVSVHGDTLVISTNEDGSNIRGIWYLIPSGSAVMYYIFTYKTDYDSIISVGYINLPQLPKLSFFDGVTLGVEQHIFCISDGKLARGKMNEKGEIGGNFETQTVSNLGSDLKSISIDHKNAVIYVAVIDGGKLKIAVYSLVSQLWDPKGFLQYDHTQDNMFEFVKIIQIDTTVYALAKSSTGVIFTAFDTVTKTWKDDVYYSFDETAEVIDADLSSYRNTMWFSLVKPASVEIISYDIIRKKICGRESTTVGGATSNTGIITSFGTTVQANTFHRIYIANQKAHHETFEIIFDYGAGIHKLKFSQCQNIDVLNKPAQPIAAFSLHNNGKLIYLILSGQTKLSLSDDL